jgi:hypothetical protein
LVVGFLLLYFGAALPASAEPDPGPLPPVVADESLPPDSGSWPSAEAGFLAAPDGWNLTARGENEWIQPMYPLTTSPASREYIVGGTFTGVVRGGGGAKLTGGTLEAGYRIGCGIILDSFGPIGRAGFTPSIRIPFTAPTAGGGFNVSAGAQLIAKPGVVNTVPVDKKSVKGGDSQIAINGFRIRIDGCAGQSFIQSYATLTGSTESNDNVITYQGVVKVV